MANSIFVKIKTFFAPWVASLKSHAPLLLAIGGYAVFTLFLTPITTQNLIFEGLGAFLFLAFSFAILLLIIKSLHLFVRMVWVIKPEQPLKFWFNDIKSYFCGRLNLPYSLPLLAGLFLFIGSFTAIKDQISTIHPFVFDRELYEIDKFLHFGTLPSDWLHSLMGHPAWALIINYIYNAWFFLIIYAFLIACFGFRQYEQGLRYLIASLLLWSFAGNGVAMLVSSAGPCYYALLGLGDAYEPLMSKLQHINDAYAPLMALDVQKLLWEGYQNNTMSITGGISAFPSLHVASTTLIARAAFAYKLSVKWFLAAFTLIILVGSIYLGWHYAVDGYAGVLLGLLAWWVSGPIAKWYVGRRSFTAPA